MNGKCLPVLLLFCACLQGFAEDLSTQSVQCISETCDLQTDDEIVFESTAQYECMERKVILNYGYHLIVTVESLKTSAANKDFLLIKSGDSIEDGTTGIILTQTLKTPRQLAIASNVVYIKFSLSGDASKDTASFKLTYKRIGNETVTTTESPMTSTLWPTAAPDDIVYIVVNITGRTDEDYESGVATGVFRRITAVMATEYCHTNLINFTGNITEKNVLINKIIHCPHNWPESSDCVQVNFSLPIVATDEDGYQLKAAHLRLMWMRYSEKHLTPENMANYDVPDANTTRWNLIAGLVVFFVLVIAGVIIVMKDSKYSCFKLPNKKRRPSGTSHIIEKEYKPSDDFCVQGIPPFIEVTDYEDADHIDNQAYHQRVTEDFDSESDFEIYHHHNNSNSVNVVYLRTNAADRNNETEF